MVNFVDLKGDIQRRMFVLSSNLTKDDTITIGSHTYTFENAEGCFTDSATASCSIIQGADEPVDSSLVYVGDGASASGNVVFRIGYYDNLDIARARISEGIDALIVKKENSDAKFTLDGYKFTILQAENAHSKEEDEYLINRGANASETAYNIARVVTAICPRINATSDGNIVLFKEAYVDTGLRGNVLKNYLLRLYRQPSEGENPITTQIGNWSFISGNDYDCIEGSHLIHYPIGEDLNATLKNFATAVNKYALKTQVGFARFIPNYQAGSAVVLTLSSHLISFSTDYYSTNTSDFPYSVGVSVLTIVEGDLIKAELYNIYGNVLEPTAQISAGVIGNQLCFDNFNKISVTDDTSVTFYYNSTMNFNSYSGYILCNRKDSEPSYPIISGCLSYLQNVINESTGGRYAVNAEIYGADSLKVSSNETLFSCTEGFLLYKLGEQVATNNVPYPSSAEEPMSIYDFTDFIETNDGKLGEIVLLKSDGSQTINIITITNKTISATLLGNGDSLALDTPIFKFEDCILNITLNKFQIDWNGQNSLFDLVRCIGTFSIVNCEFCLRNVGPILRLERAVNFTLDNKHSSYLINSSVGNGFRVFSVHQSSINISSKYNAIDVASDASGFFYFSEQSVVTDIAREDVFSGSNPIDSSDVNSNPKFYFDSNKQTQESFNQVTKNSVMTPYTKLFCGFKPNDATLYRWSFNLTCDSKALALSSNNTAPKDIFGRTRGLNKIFGKRVITFVSSDNVMVSKENSYIRIDESVFYILNTYHDYSSIVGTPITTANLLDIIVESICYTTNYRLVRGMYEKNGITHYTLTLFGEVKSIKFSTDINALVESNEVFIEGNNASVSDDTFYQSCIDFGARQKYTVCDETFYVDTSINSSEHQGEARQGTESSMFSCQDMVEWCMSMYPRFGNTTFILKSNSGSDEGRVTSVPLMGSIVSSDSVDSSEYARLYGDVKIGSTMMGLRAVPVLKHDENATDPLFIVGCRGSANLVFENILIVSPTQVLNVYDDSYSSFGIKFVNCIIKNYADNTPVVDFKNSHFEAVESTMLNSGNGSILSGTGVAEIEASILGKGAVGLVETDYNHQLLNYNYEIVDEEGSDEVSDANNVDTNYIGPDCLVNAFGSIDYSNFSINDFQINIELPNNKAIDFIPNVYNLVLNNPTAMFDIGGRYRYNEVSKVSLDAGAIETEAGLVDPTEKIFFVSLGDTYGMKNGNRIDYISWEDFKELMENTDSFENIYKVYLSGYGVKKEKIVLDESIAFSEQARIEFYGENNCVYEGDSLIEAKCDYVNIVISGLTLRTKKSTIVLKNDSSVLLTNCFFVGSASEVIEHYFFDFGTGCSIKMFSCSLQCNDNMKFFKIADCTKGNFYISMIGCIAQGILLEGGSYSSFGFTPGEDDSDANAPIVTSTYGQLVCHNIQEFIGTDYEVNEDLIDIEVFKKDKLKSSDSKLLWEPEDAFAIYYTDTQDGTIYELLKEGMKYNWLIDIVGNKRSLRIEQKVFENDEEQTAFLRDNNLFTSYGCYDTKALQSDRFYGDEPNREITCITEFGRTMITKMLSNTARFKIEGFVICGEGYDYSNPVIASKIREDVHRLQLVYKINPVFAEAQNSTLTIGNMTFVHGTDFKGSTPKKAVVSLVKAINKVPKASGDEIVTACIFAASVVSEREGIFMLERIRPEPEVGEDENSISWNIPDGLEKISEQCVDAVYNVRYMDNQILPKVGFNTFEYIDYLPLAISMYYRIERESWKGGFGSEVVIARILDSDIEEEKNMLFPLCVCHHGLITKSNDSFIVGRIVLQI